MSALDVLVLASRTTKSWKEQFGRVIIEAHACQTPVIGSNSGAIPSVIGEAGIVVPERNSAALGAAITKLAANPRLARQMGETGRERAVQHYSWQGVADQMAQIYGHVGSRQAYQNSLPRAIQHS